MSMNPLNDISKVYLESVAVDEAAAGVIAKVAAKAGPALAKAGKAAAACAKDPSCRDAAGSAASTAADLYGKRQDRKKAEAEARKAEAEKNKVEEEVGITSTEKMRKALKDAALRRKEQKAVENAKKAKEVKEEVELPPETAAAVRKHARSIRYHARAEGLQLNQAYNQYISKHNMSATERTWVRKKLGLIAEGLEIQDLHGKTKYEIVDLVTPPSLLQQRAELQELSKKDTKKLEKASVLSQSDDPKDQDRARARQVEVDYKDLMKQKKKKMKEDIFYNWRSEMSEADQTFFAISNQKTDIAGLPANPKKRKPRTQATSAKEITGVGVNNKVEINPEMSKQMEGVIADMGGKLLEVVEVGEAYKAVTNSPDSLAKMNKRYKPVKKIKNPTDRPFRDRLKDPDYKVDVDEEKKLLPKLKMYRKAGNLARKGDPESMKKQTKIVSVLNKETSRGYKDAALAKLRDGGSPQHQKEDYESKKTDEVLGALKKKKKDFKKRYGKMGPDVMLAVAKKTVKKKGDTSKSDDRYAYESADPAFDNVVGKLRKKYGKDAVLTKDSPKPKAQPKPKAKPQKPLTDKEKAHREVIARYGGEANYKAGRGLGT